MYALKPSRPQPQPVRPLRVVPKANSRQKQRHAYRAIVYEASAKLAVNVVVSVAATAALIQLIPYRSSQEVRLQELQAAVQSTSDRVQRVQASFNYYFDPSQTREIMQEQSNRIDPQRRQIIWKQPGNAAVGTPINH
ncbi:hypothetical protein ACN4EK_23080 [Pantanalinema rosaneae CENA516]|uniref:slr1601 family putative cell division protein n=1 Tax=Pantanalinema rosaneae TaxID=1620701 RepID=UPI003D6FF9CD